MWRWKPRGHNFIKRGSRCKRHTQELCCPAEGRQKHGRILSQHLLVLHVGVGSAAAVGCAAPALVHCKELKCHPANISPCRELHPNRLGSRDYARRELPGKLWRERKIQEKQHYPKEFPGGINQLNALFSVTLPGSCSWLCFCPGSTRLAGLAMLGAYLLPNTGSGQVGAHIKAPSQNEWV